MSTIVTRAGKGSPLTNAEVDSNFTNLNTDKVESITSADGSVVVSSSGTTRDLSVGTAANTGTLISQVRNETGATLTKGTVVYISGAAGNKALVSKALATGDSTSAQTYGMVQADIPHNQNGYVVVVGAVSGLNTSAFADGTQLYLSGVSAGGYTNTKPYAPTHLVYVGIVTYSHNTQGTIQVKIQNGYELDEIHDVSARSPVDGQTLVYVSSTGLWTKTDQASMSVGSAATLATARNINGVSFNGSADITVADATKLPLAGGTLTGKLTLDGRNEIYGVPTNAGTIAGFMGGTSGGTTAARTQSLNTQTLLNVAAIGYTGSAWVGGAGLSFVATENITASNRGTKAVLTAIAAGDSVATTMEFNGSALTINGSTAVTSSNYTTYAPTKTGTGASGTWGINITGNAATATSATDSTKLPLAGGTLTGSLIINTGTGAAEYNDVWIGGANGWSTNESHGINTYYGATPSGTSLFTRLDSLYNGTVAVMRWKNFYYGAVQTSTVMTLTATSATTAALNVTGAITQASNQVLHAGNYNSYSPTLTGGNASGTWGINITGSAGSISSNGYTLTTGSSEGVSSGWIGFPNGQGIWSSVNGAHLVPNNAGSYGSWYMYGTKGSWHGLHFGSGSTLMMNADTVGFHREGVGWQMRWAAGTGYVHKGASGGGTEATILDSSNYTSYSPSLSGSYVNINAGGLFSRYSYNAGTEISDATTAYTLSPNYGTTTVAMHGSHGYLGGYATTLTMSGYERYGATQISAKYNATTAALAIRNYNQDVGGWNSWVGIISTANYSSYALPLSGGALTGNVTLNTSDGEILVTPTGWRATDRAAIKIRSKANTPAEIDLRHTVGGVESGWHISARDTSSESELHLYRFNMTSAGAVDAAGSFLQMFTFKANGGFNSAGAITQAGNQVLHAGNYSSYALPLTGGTLTGTLYFTDTTNGLYKSGGRLNVRSESTDNVAEYASYGLYLPKSGQAAGLYVESPIEARGGLRLGNSAGSGTITVGATTDATANRLVQRDGSGHINAAYVFGTYFNSNAGNSENPTIGQVWTQSTGDNYLRKSTPAHFISQLGLLTTSNYSSYALPLSGGTVSGNVSFGGAVNVNNRDIRYFENDSFKEFYVGGDANTYYPVLFGVSSWFHFARWSISRGYSDTAPWDPIGTGAHKGGLTLTWEWSGDGAWGGNDKTIRVIQFAEQYTTMVGGMHLSVNGFIVWLRGGNAYYRFHGPGGTMNSATPYYSTFTASNGGTFSPRSYDSGTVTAEVTNRMPVRGSHELYDTGNRVLHAGNYSSYALPISGGVVSGAVRASQITAGGSTNTDANLGVQGTTHLTGTIYYGGSVGNTSSWSSLSTSSSGTHTFSGSRFIFDRYGYGSQSLLDLQNGAITLSQPTTISTGGGYPLQNLSTQRYIARFYNTSASGAGWWLANDSNTLVFHADSSGDKASINTDGTFSAANHVGSKFIAAYGNINDNVDGSPWYGLGNAGNLLGTGGNVVQLAGYFGLRLRSSTTVLDIGPDRATLNKTLNANGAAIRQGNNLARPNASWGSSGATGMVIFKLPGSSGNYGMVHMVFDIYEYNSNSVSTVIVGGHNWASSWYNTGANVIGQLGKQVRLGYKDGQYCVVFGDSGSYWEYGQIVLRKIQNGAYYDNIMDLGADVSVVFTSTESFSNIGGDLRALRTPASFNAAGAITQAGNQVLHAGNYTNYSPSLGGSGASGTWGISVSGSAAQLQGYQWFSSGKDIRGSDIYADSWLRNYNVNTGLYNQSTGCYFYSNGSASWGITGSGAGIELQFRANHQSTVRGYVYADSSSNFGLLHNNGGWSVQVYNGGNGYLHGTWNGGNIRANRANGNFYIDDNYGYGIVGAYASTRYQGVFFMGDSYKMSADGTSLSNMYGIAWSHPNAGGAAGNLTDHGMLIINNGGFRCAISNSIVASGNVTAYSDERLKTNWRDMPEDYVARLAQVKVGIYDRTDEEELMTQVGVSAQSFQKLLPQAIMTAKDEMQTLSVSYGNAALASAVELAKDNVELRARIERLESLINKLIGD